MISPKDDPRTGVCPGCHRVRYVRKDGTIEAHRLPPAEAGWRKPCDGSRRPPREPFWVAAIRALAEGRISITAAATEASE